VDGSRVFEVTRSGTPQVVWEMDVSIPLTYRAERIPSLYPGVTW
jgi:arylsulfate sulfotransferase